MSYILTYQIKRINISNTPGYTKSSVAASHLRPNNFKAGIFLKHYEIIGSNVYRRPSSNTAWLGIYVVQVYAKGNRIIVARFVFRFQD